MLVCSFSILIANFVFIYNLRDHYRQPFVVTYALCKLVKFNNRIETLFCIGGIGVVRLAFQRKKKMKLSFTKKSKNDKNGP